MIAAALGLPFACRNLRSKVTEADFRKTEESTLDAGGDSLWERSYQYFHSAIKAADTPVM